MHLHDGETIITRYEWFISLYLTWMKCNLVTFCYRSVWFGVISGLLISCITEKNIIHEKDYFFYGFTTDTALIRESMVTEWDIYRFKDGDIIADIGCATAWLEGSYCVKGDSLTFYAIELPRVMNRIARSSNAYKSLNPGSRTTVIPHRGRPASTHLPDTSVHHVLLRETWHHVKRTQAMLADMKRILKPGGTIFVLEKQTDTVFFHPICQAYIVPKEDMIKEFEAHGFHYSEVHEFSTSESDAPAWTDDKKEKKQVLVFKKG